MLTRAGWPSLGLSPLYSSPTPTSSAYSRRAQRLPYDVLIRIFEQAARLPRQQDWGGLLFEWQSNEDISRLVRICKDWRLPAEHVLYRSVSLLSAKEARGFLYTTSVRQDLAEKVVFLVVGLSEEETWPSSDEEGVPNARAMLTGRTQAATSNAMVDALGACPSLRHFQVRPLHDSAREALLVALNKTTALETLVCAPRLRKPNVEWTGCFFQPSDIVALALPTLRNLEVDAWTRDVEPTPPADSSTCLRSSIIRSSKLVTLRLRFEISDAHLFTLLEVAGELQSADIYVERMVPPEAAAQALTHTLSSLRELRWTTNPPIEGFSDVNLAHVPLFDRVLPRFEVLHSLSISATDVSPSILSLLPVTLRDLEVQAYTYRGPFKYSDEMLRTLANAAVNLKLERFTVCDSEEVWTEENVLAMTTACAARSIAFKFVAEEDGDTDSR